MLKRLPLYPILFAVFPVLSLTAYNIDQVALDAVPRPLLISLLLGILLFGLARLLLRDWDRAALAVLAALFLFFIYGQVYNLLEDVTLAGASIFRHRTLLPLFGVLFALAYILLYVVSSSPVDLPWGSICSRSFAGLPLSKISLSILQQESANRSVQAAASRVAANADQPMSTTSSWTRTGGKMFYEVQLDMITAPS